MGADFNILEYADPDIDQLGGGKTNIFDLDDLEEQDEVVTKDEKQKKDMKEEEQKSKSLDSTNVISQGIQGSSASPLQTSTAGPLQTLTATSNVLSQSQTMAPNLNQSETQQVQSQTVMPSSSQQQQHILAIQQQMYNHMQQQAAIGKPLTPGTLIKAADGSGITGVVTSQNSVTVSYPANIQHQQRISQQHLQGSGNFVYRFRLKYNNAFKFAVAYYEEFIILTSFDIEN